eukprot:4933064-Pyramimonas_sp.AAC.1
MAPNSPLAQIMAQVILPPDTYHSLRYHHHLGDDITGQTRLPQPMIHIILATGFTSQGGRRTSPPLRALMGVGRYQISQIRALGCPGSPHAPSVSGRSHDHVVLNPPCPLGLHTNIKPLKPFYH